VCKIGRDEESVVQSRHSTIWRAKLIVRHCDMSARARVVYSVVRHGDRHSVFRTCHGMAPWLCNRQRFLSHYLDFSFATFTGMSFGSGLCPLFLQGADRFGAPGAPTWSPARMCCQGDWHMRVKRVWREAHPFAPRCRSLAPSTRAFWSLVLLPLQLPTD
jgi:hypothetical protein